MSPTIQSGIVAPIEAMGKWPFLSRPTGVVKSIVSGINCKINSNDIPRNKPVLVPKVRPWPVRMSQRFGRNKMGKQRQ